MNRRFIQKGGVILFWLLVWQGAAMLLNNSIVFVGPLEMMSSLVQQLGTSEFWRSLCYSTMKIMGGFLCAFFSAILLSGLAFRFRWLQILLEPLIHLQKNIPVASFVVLLLILIGSENLSTAIVFLMSFPIIYINMSEGLLQADTKLLEMSRVFRMTAIQKLLYIYRPAILPFLLSSSRAALGISWKSGVAAEIIGVPSHSIGEHLYLSKIYLSTDSLFAWTLVIIVVSMLFEKLFLWILKKAGGKTCR